MIKNEWVFDDEPEGGPIDPDPEPEENPTSPDPDKPA